MKGSNTANDLKGLTAFVIVLFSATAGATWNGWLGATVFAAGLLVATIIYTEKWGR